MRDCGSRKREVDTGGLRSKAISSSEYVDFYKVLGVDGNATEDEIRRSFRRLAKKYHPDRNSRRVRWSAGMMTRLLLAYRTLTDEAGRKLHDRHLKARENRNRDYYQEMLERGRDPESAAALILYFLLTGREDRAVSVYELSSAKFERFELAEQLSRKDWLDCKFLLAEEYEHRKRYEVALAFYEEVYHADGDGNHYGLFRDEIRERIRRLCCRTLAKNTPPDQAIRYYERTLKVYRDKNHRAFVHKKIAECRERMGQLEPARESLKTAFRICPDLKGAVKICRKLGFQPPGG